MTSDFNRSRSVHRRLLSAHHCITTSTPGPEKIARSSGARSDDNPTAASAARSFWWAIFFSPIRTKLRQADFDPPTGSGLSADDEGRHPTTVFRLDPALSYLGS